ncbi:MAG: hypothetical protein ACJ0FQ_03670 [Gammaproteobacteria bacterium]|nr:MAG: hypothetical protein CBD96_005230 [Gammaproteobacteria bacterium TMED236]|tara:strand:+ start:3017 stop:3556 length:540 start_codon:yes stop_codon:yes gene_type:complete
MRSKIFLASLLLTPLLVLLISTLSFQSGYSPKSTKNNGIFFTEYFDATKLNLIDDVENLKFEDGKWLFATYASNGEDIAEALYLMRQLNVALNRDINKLKRVIFSKDRKELESQLVDYPRIQVIIDSEDNLYEKLLETGNKEFFLDQKIFIIDPYGRAVMFFPVSMDPKLILKDLKVLI